MQLLLGLYPQYFQMVLDTVSFECHTRVTPNIVVVHVICEVLLVKMPFSDFLL